MPFSYSGRNYQVGLNPGEYYALLLNQIKKGQSQIIKDKEEWIKSCETEIVRLQSEKEQIQKEKYFHQKQAVESAAEVIRLKGTINVLQIQLQNVVVSDDPDRIISDLQRLGIRSIKLCNIR